MKTAFTSISVRSEVINRIRQHQIRTLRVATTDSVEFPPSLSKWIENAIEQRLAREGLGLPAEVTTETNSSAQP